MIALECSIAYVFPTTLHPPHILQKCFYLSLMRSLWETSPVPGHTSVMSLPTVLFYYAYVWHYLDEDAEWSSRVISREECQSALFFCASILEGTVYERRPSSRYAQDICSNSLPWNVVGGTSVSTPLWAVLAALATIWQRGWEATMPTRWSAVLSHWPEHAGLLARHEIRQPDRTTSSKPRSVLQVVLLLTLRRTLAHQCDGRSVISPCLSSSCPT